MWLALFQALGELLEGGAGVLRLGVGREGAELADLLVVLLDLSYGRAPAPTGKERTDPSGSVSRRDKSKRRKGRGRTRARGTGA